MSEQAKTALINANGSHQGANVTGPRNVMQWLKETGMVGAEHGLTRKGAIHARALKDAALNEAFGS